MEKRKRYYSEPELEIVIFSTYDIVTSSGDYDSPDSTDTDWGGGQPLGW